MFWVGIVLVMRWLPGSVLWVLLLGVFFIFVRSLEVRFIVGVVILKVSLVMI